MKIFRTIYTVTEVYDKGGFLKTNCASFSTLEGAEARFVSLINQCLTVNGEDMLSYESYYTEALFFGSRDLTEKIILCILYQMPFMIRNYQK